MPVMNSKLGLIFLAVCVRFSSCDPVEQEAHLGHEIIVPEDGFQGATTPAPLRFAEKWDEWRTWEAPENIRKMAPYYKSGYDYDGLPIITSEYGKWNYRALAQLKPDEVKDFLRHYEQFIRRAQTEGAANNSAGIVLICDWDGFFLANFATSEALQLVLKSFTSISRVSDAVRHAYMINTNFGAQTIVNFARPFFGNYMEKFEIYGAQREKWRLALLRKIPQSQLPLEYGGDKNWKPAPWII